MVLTDAQLKWKLLNGVICVYKNAGISVNNVRRTLIGHICEDLCKLESRPPLNHVYIEGDPAKSLTVSVAPKYSDSPLVTGPRYQPQDVRCSWATILGRDTSGVFGERPLHTAGSWTGSRGCVAWTEQFFRLNALGQLQEGQQPQRLWTKVRTCGDQAAIGIVIVDCQSCIGKVLELQALVETTEAEIIIVIGINKGARAAQKFHLSRPTRSYHIKGQLGYATDTYFRDGKVVEKATFGHVKQAKLDRVLASVQAAHQKHMFQQAGVDIQSQTAYELASRGMIRPPANTVPLLYNVRCTYFNPPDFTLEVTCINEYESYLKTLIHDIGIQLHTCATCTGIHCIRHGLFTLEHALLPKHWHLKHILDSMQECHQLIQQTVNNTVENTSPTLVPAEEQKNSVVN